MTKTAKPTMAGEYHLSLPIDNWVPRLIEIDRLYLAHFQPLDIDRESVRLVSNKNRMSLETTARIDRRWLVEDGWSIVGRN